MTRGRLQRSTLAAVLALGTALLVPACAGLKTDYQLARERARDYVAAHPGLDPATAEAVRENRILEGMTMEQVVAAWGRPAYVRRFRNGELQQWFFGCGWPHLCNPPSDFREAWMGMAEDYYQSRAIFENGRVVDFRS